MSVRTVLEDIHEKIARLTPTEREQVRAWLEEHRTEEEFSEDEGEEMTEEDLLIKLKSLEEHYGLSSEEFVRHYDARDPDVLKLDQAGFWRTLYDWWEQKRDETSQS
jgi:hypothetical protein